MGRNKRYYNKDIERARQEREQMINKYKNSTAVCLKEKVAGETNLDATLEATIDFINLYQKTYNVCRSGFARKTLKKSFSNTYNAYKESIDLLANLGIVAPGLAKKN